MYDVIDELVYYLDDAEQIIFMVVYVIEIIIFIYSFIEMIKGLKPDSNVTR